MIPTVVISSRKMWDFNSHNRANDFSSYSHSYRGSVAQIAKRESGKWLEEISWRWKWRSRRKEDRNDGDDEVLELGREEEGKAAEKKDRHQKNWTREENKRKNLMVEKKENYEMKDVKYEKTRAKRKKLIEEGKVQWIEKRWSLRRRKMKGSRKIVKWRRQKKNRGGKEYKVWVNGIKYVTVF